MLSKQAIKSFISAETIASAVAFLAADEAATITGISLPVEGGWTAQ
jgi:3-hydroxybutyrate dehydrogenase